MVQKTTTEDTEEAPKEKYRSINIKTLGVTRRVLGFLGGSKITTEDTEEAPKKKNGSKNIKALGVTRRVLGFLGGSKKLKKRII